MVGIVIGSTVKGLMTGVIIGFFATKVQSLVVGTIFGLVVGAFFAYLILLMNPGHTLQHHAAGQPRRADRGLRGADASVDGGTARAAL